MNDTRFTYEIKQGIRNNRVVNFLIEIRVRFVIYLTRHRGFGCNHWGMTGHRWAYDLCWSSGWWCLGAFGSIKQ